ncbi:unnamed protein product [Effrenium voratum]|uniref:Uncharacterized protein n=1 Tax=Effrenium voratum TaxID=2562239 RepID=A0AA36N8T0_9DINO|nr:unnamed protein product [Effrenium voratum]
MWTFRQSGSTEAEGLRNVFFRGRSRKGCGRFAQKKEELADRALEFSAEAAHCQTQSKANGVRGQQISDCLTQWFAEVAGGSQNLLGFGVPLLAFAGIRGMRFAACQKGQDFPTGEKGAGDHRNFTRGEGVAEVRGRCREFAEFRRSRDSPKFGFILVCLGAALVLPLLHTVNRSRAS